MILLVFYTYLDIIDIIAISNFNMKFSLYSLGLV